MKIKVSNVGKFIIIVLYKILLDLTYCSGVIPFYNYQGFSYSFSMIHFLVSYLIVIFISIVLVRLINETKISNIIITLLFFMYYIPITTIITYTKNDFRFFSLVTLYFMCLLLFNKIIRINLPKMHKPEKKIDWFIVITIVLSIIAFFVSGIYSGFNISFDLSEYYELRFEAREASMPVIVGYLFNWARYIIPIGMTYTLIKRKYTIAAFLSFAQVLCFSFNGKKSSLVLFFLAFIIAFLFKDNYWKKTPQMFCILGAISLLSARIWGISSALVKYIIRRVFMIPAYIGYEYYEFFSTHEYDYLRSSTLRFLHLDTPYLPSISRVIGNVYTNNINSNANTGLFGDAFANFGIIGCFLYPLLIVLALKVLESCIGKMETRIKAITCITVAYMFLNGAFFKIMLTNGYIVICILSYLVSQHTIDLKKKENT